MTPVAPARLAAWAGSLGGGRFATPADIAVATWFLIGAAIHIVTQFQVHVANGVIGGDAQSYSNAAHAWLTSGNPWTVTTPWPFAAPPPTLLFFVPTAFLPPTIAGIVWIVADVLAIIITVRILKLRWWWAFWPPLVSSAVSGNPEPVMLLLLVGGGSWLAPAIKPYAIVPLVLLRRWRAVIAATALIAIASVVLPWSAFFAELPRTTRFLRENAGLSAWAYPILLPFVALALWRLGIRRSAWLAAPLLWPASQLWYAAVALPAAGRWMGVAFSIPVPGVSSVAVIAEALWRGGREITRSRLHPGSGSDRLSSTRTEFHGQ